MTIKDNGDGTFSVTAPCSFKKPKVTVTKYKDKVVAITMTDDDNRITEVLWEAPKPLTDEEIKQIFADQTGYYIDNGLVKGLAIMDFARAIEERHGIK